MDLNRLRDSIKKHEGCSLAAYQDTEGVWTAGWGMNLEHRFGKQDYTGATFTQVVVDGWLEEEIKRAVCDAQTFPEAAFLNTDARDNAFIEMCYNLGAPRLHKFQNMLDAIRDQDWLRAAGEMLNSKWAAQVKGRALTLATMMRTGQFLP